MVDATSSESADGMHISFSAWTRAFKWQPSQAHLRTERWGRAGRQGWGLTIVSSAIAACCVSGGRAVTHTST
ncbi:hypothetical protein BDZ31_002935 [Conexibacter arvalis]|uniref:Uncharacterized protein n=1 Tax=Conexibacter arvalis TaxID=912552 RepID=A0A840IHA9_9ACTN|nr:hypothetical protein [Conexibacter arvalis]